MVIHAGYTLLLHKSVESFSQVGLEGCSNVAPRFLLAKAQDYVAQILGHEGPGSMHSILKGLALGLRA